MIEFLMLAVVLTAFVQPNIHRFIAANAYSLAMVIQYLSFANKEEVGTAYFLSVGLAAAFVVLVVGGLDKTTRMGARLITACVAVLGLNFISWLFWMQGSALTAQIWTATVDLYALFSAFIYLYVIWSMASRSKQDERNFGVASWSYRVFAQRLHNLKGISQVFGQT